MNKLLTILTLLTGLVLIVAGCSNDPALPDVKADTHLAETVAPAGDDALADKHFGRHATVVVANRNDGTISVIDARKARLVATVDLPRGEGDAQPEPMYVNGVKRYGRVFVGDRANNRVVAFDARTFAVEGMVPTGQGVFHQWADGLGRQLWVNNDVDNTITVIDPGSLTVMATIDIPADLVAMGGKPHDVILSPLGRYAYVTVLGLAGPNDYLLQYDTDSFSELNRQPVGKDPHLSIGAFTYLYVPCQYTDQVLVFHPRTLRLVTELTVPGAHGAAMAPGGRRFYTTNLPGGGSDAIFTIDTRRNEIVGDPVATPYAVPHNLAITPDGKLLYVTHSGSTSDKVTVYRLRGRDRAPAYVGEVSVGLNPFGLGIAF